MLDTAGFLMMIWNDFCRYGKTTLLQHIAARQLAIPPNIDVLLCEQEVVADATPAVDVVLKADTKRLELLALEKKLTHDSAKGDMKATEKLRDVYDQLRAIGADSAEARARRILAGKFRPYRPRSTADFRPSLG